MLTKEALSEDLLDYSLPDFNRISWVSDAARTVWEPRIDAIKAWLVDDLHKSESHQRVPDCCQKAQLEDRGLDPLRILLNSGHEDLEVRSYSVEIDPSLNIFLRDFGVSYLSYLPCSFECESSLKLYQSEFESLKSFPEDSPEYWLYQLMSWPMEWSSLHGIAELVSPVFKVISDTRALGSRYTIQKMGDTIPPERAKGVKFPFKVPRKLHLSETKGFKNGLENALVNRKKPATKFTYVDKI